MVWSPGTPQGDDHLLGDAGSPRPWYGLELARLFRLEDISSLCL